MAFQTSPSEKPLSEINITPMVDVMLVLLIIFMVTAPMMNQGIDVNLPKTSSKSNVNVLENDIVLTIDAYKNIYIGKNKISKNDLPIKLKAIFENKQSKNLYLESDQKVPYGFVVEIMASAKNAGIEKVGLVTQPH